jgi:hypothetical protein
MSSDSYIREINSLDAEIKRSNDRTKALRTQRQNAKNNLYNYMVRHKLEQVTYGTTTLKIEQCAPPKPRSKVKPKKLRTAEAIELFRTVGIPNPEGFYSEFEATQKSKKSEEDDNENPRNSKKKSKKSDYDDILGF